MAFRSRAGERAERSAAGRVEKQGVEIAQKERRPKRNEGGALEEPQEKKKFSEKQKLIIYSEIMKPKFDG